MEDNQAKKDDFLRKIKEKSSSELEGFRRYFIEKRLKKNSTQEADDLLSWIIDQITEEIIDKTLSGK